MPPRRRTPTSRYPARVSTNGESPTARATSLVRRILATPKEYRAPLMRELADAIIDLREEFVTPAGDPDWRGTSYSYRVRFGEVLSAGGVRTEDRHSFQQALRYHISNALRERLDDETLDALGLQRESARERSRGGREDRSALLRAAHGEEAPVAALKAILAARALLLRVDAETLRGLAPRDAQAAARALDDAARRARTLRSALP